MTDKQTRLDMADRLDSIIDANEPSAGCLCGRGEWCEKCSPSSSFNQLLTTLRLLSCELRGKPIRPLSPKDFGRSIKVVIPSYP